MVDMRWGVTNEVQNDHMTSTCCLKEIRNCQNVSIGPNFVVRTISYAKLERKTGLNVFFVKRRPRLACAVHKS
ncbi:hypothetical protein DPMN_110678 [Dreissena polymorpha]|uniref:Uncharacterized protein n=1 Tax=Dreissena polymorpha TaxID=45954 RepID=A0A9D4KCI0_DREPO|nr:hypothetical protein DPMN_110678 [Dreissena polymorpha]